MFITVYTRVFQQYYDIVQQYTNNVIYLFILHFGCLLFKRK